MIFALSTLAFNLYCSFNHSIDLSQSTTYLSSLQIITSDLTNFYLISFSVFRVLMCAIALPASLEALIILVREIRLRTSLDIRPAVSTNRTSGLIVDLASIELL